MVCYGHVAQALHIGVTASGCGGLIPLSRAAPDQCRPVSPAVARRRAICLVDCMASSSSNQSQPKEAELWISTYASHTLCDFPLPFIGLASSLRPRAYPRAIANLRGDKTLAGPWEADPPSARTQLMDLGQYGDLDNSSVRNAVTGRRGAFDTMGGFTIWTFLA